MIGVVDLLGVEVRVPRLVGEGPSALSVDVLGPSISFFSHLEADGAELGGQIGEDLGALVIGADDGQVVGKREDVAVGSGLLRLLEDRLDREAEVLHAERFAPGAACLAGDDIGVGAAEVHEREGRSRAPRVLRPL